MRGECNEEPPWEERCRNVRSGVAETSVSLWEVGSGARKGFLDRATQVLWAGVVSGCLSPGQEKAGLCVPSSECKQSIVSKSRV